MATLKGQPIIAFGDARKQAFYEKSAICHYAQISKVFPLYGLLVYDFCLGLQTLI